MNCKDMKRSCHGFNTMPESVWTDCGHKNSAFNQDLPNKRAKVLSTQPSPFTRRTMALKCTS